MVEGSRAEATKRLELCISFDEPDVVAVETAVRAYAANQITRSEMAKRVKRIAGQYDGLSQHLAFEEIESVLGEEIGELWEGR
jgi:hypothetical protein